MTVLLSESQRNLQKMIKEFNRDGLKVGLKMNMTNTKVVFNNQLTGQQIMIGNEVLEWKNAYTCDKQLVQTKNKTEIRWRIRMG